MQSYCTRAWASDLEFIGGLDPILNRILASSSQESPGDSWFGLAQPQAATVMLEGRFGNGGQRHCEIPAADSRRGGGVGLSEKGSGIRTEDGIF
jgi:hypothetical protein